MPIFLKTNTKDKRLAFDTALRMAVHYDADVCCEKDKTDGYWHVVLQAANLEMPMRGEKKQQEFLKEAQQRLALFGNKITFTAIEQHAFLLNPKEAYRISNNCRMCLLFTIDPKPDLKPEEFVNQFLEEFYPTSRMLLRYKNVNRKRFEVRVEKKAFVNDADANRIFLAIQKIMKKISSKSIKLKGFMSSSNSASKEDYVDGYEGTTTFPFSRALPWDPIYGSEPIHGHGIESSKDRWFSVVTKIPQVEIKFKTGVYQPSEDQKSLVKEEELSAISIKEKKVDGASYSVHPVFFNYIANNNNYLNQLLNGKITEAWVVRNEHFTNPVKLTYSIKSLEPHKLNSSFVGLYKVLAVYFRDDPELKQDCLDNRVKELTIHVNNKGECKIITDVIPKEPTNSSKQEETSKTTLEPGK
jgi:hypothetical protein